LFGKGLPSVKNLFFKQEGHVPVNIDIYIGNQCFWFTS
jgi:hypothetical protein